MHTVKATLQVLDLSKAGSALELAVYAENQKIGRGNYRPWITDVVWEEAEAGQKN